MEKERAVVTYRYLPCRSAPKAPDSSGRFRMCSRRSPAHPAGVASQGPSPAPLAREGARSRAPMTAIPRDVSPRASRHLSEPLAKPLPEMTHESVDRQAVLGHGIAIPHGDGPVVERLEVDRDA